MLDNRIEKHSFNKYILSTYHVPDTVLSAKDIVMKMTNMASVLRELKHR